MNLAYLGAREGKRTLLWDLDPQGASTYTFRMRARIRPRAQAVRRVARPAYASFTPLGARCFMKPNM